MTDDNSRSEKKAPIKSTQVVASAIASAASAVALSNLGVAGTVGGAAIGSVIITAGSAFSAHFLDRGGEKLRAVRQERTRAGSAVSGARSQRHLGTERTTVLERTDGYLSGGYRSVSGEAQGSSASRGPSTAQGASTAQGPSAPQNPSGTRVYPAVGPGATAAYGAAGHGTAGHGTADGTPPPLPSAGNEQVPAEWSAESILDRMNRRRRLKRSLLVAASAFVMVMLAITGFELATGNSLSDTVQGNTTTKSRPSIVGGGVANPGSESGSGADRDGDSSDEQDSGEDGAGQEPEQDASGEDGGGSDRQDGSDESSGSGSESGQESGGDSGNQSGGDVGSGSDSGSGNDSGNDSGSDGGSDGGSGTEPTPVPTPTPAPTAPEQPTESPPGFVD